MIQWMRFSGSFWRRSRMRPALRPSHPVRRGTPAKVAKVPTGSHRERLLATELAHLKLCSEQRCQTLQAAGLQTAGDLLVCRPRQVCQEHGWSRKAEVALRRLRAAVRLSVSVEGMAPRDALVLIAIHRRNVQSLAAEQPALLHRDWERFSLSSRGSRLVGRRGIPSIRRIKAWILICQQTMAKLADAATPSLTLRIS